MADDSRDNEHSSKENDSRGGSSVNALKLGLTAIVVLLVVAAGVASFVYRNSVMETLVAYEGQLRQYQQENFLLVYVIAFVIYVVVTALSLPLAAAMTLICAWLFGFWPALLLVSFASTTGATLAFLTSRYLLRDMIQRRYGERLKQFNEALDREGAFYLFTLRLIPAVPFFVINVVMGLTRMRVTTYWWVSQLGMLAGTAVYVYAGSNIPTLEQIADPAKLRASDIQDWPALMKQLAAGKNANDPTPAGQIWGNLPMSARTLVQDSADGKELDDEQNQRIIVALNDVIKRRDLALSEPWQNVELADQTITQQNRTLLQNAFPGLISAPKPILNWQLWVGLILLGVFPLAAKKGMNWYRRKMIGNAAKIEA